MSQLTLTRQHKILISVCLAVVAGALLFVLDPVQHRFMPKCIFKLLTGLDCPGCGFQRAVHALLHGHFMEALRYNLFFAVAIPYLLALLCAHTVLPRNVRNKALLILEGRVACYVYVVTFTAWFIIRNILHI